jgi:hypothetical protein
MKFKIRELRLGSDMIMRSVKPEDIQDIDRIWREHHSDDFGVPNRLTPANLDDQVIEVDGAVVAYGQARLNCELKLILDLNQPLRIKVLCLQMFLIRAFDVCKVAGLEEVFAFIKDPEYSKLLNKHFGFEHLESTKETLVKEL